MTRQKTFKARVRARMARTGESYTTARAQLLRDVAATPDEFPGLLPDYDRFGGLHGDTAVLTNAFAQARVISPHDGEPYSEAMLFGLCGGIGFMYFVFEYAGHPPMMTFVARSWSMPGAFSQGAFDRTGVKISTSETGSARVAAKALDSALEAGRAAICTVDPVRLPYRAIPEQWAGNSAQLVAVAGADGDRLWIDDVCVRPNEIPRTDFASARASYKKAKHRLVTIDAAPEAHDLAAGVRLAISATARGFHEAPFKGYASSFGLAGLEKFARLLEDPKDKKGWRRVFATPEHAFAGLKRVHECTRFAVTPPSAGRPLYAEFLDEAAEVTGDDSLRGCADTFRRSGELWDDVAELAIPDQPALVRCRELLERQSELLVEEGSRGAAELAAVREELDGLAAACTLQDVDAFEVYASIAKRVREIAELERSAVDRLVGTD